MAWSNFPLATGSDLQRYFEGFIQIWKAARERSAILGSNTFPSLLNYTFTQGTITAATATSISDNTKTWTAGEWAGPKSPPRLPYDPGAFDLIVDLSGESLYADPQQILQVGISNNTATTLSYGEPDWITFAQLDSYATLVGKPYKIIRSQGLWWDRRWPEWPPGLLFDWGAMDAATMHSLKDLSAADWKENQWQGFDVVVYTTAERYRRAPITGNSNNSLFWTSQGWTPKVNGGRYGIIKSGALFKPEAITGALKADEPLSTDPPTRASAPLFAWYRGLQSYWYSHHPDATNKYGSADNLGTAKLPVATVSWMVSDGFGGCEDLFPPAQAFDADPHSDVEEDSVCSDPDHFYAPDVYKTLRQIQAHLEGICVNFLDPTVNYDAYALRYISNLTPTIWFIISEIGTGWQKTIATVGVGGTNRCTFSALGVPYTPLPVQFTVLRGDGSYLADGTGIINTDGRLDSAVDRNGTNIDFTANSSEAVGKTIILATGWTRDFPREFKYLYPVEYFLPSVEDGGAVDPPLNTAEECGSYVSRAASTHYAEHAPDFGSVPAGAITENGPAFVNGDVARYIADNFKDPTTSDALEGGLDPQTPYVDARFTGQNATHNAFGDGGNATDGGNFFLRDSSKDWWGGVRREETGSATGGSATTLIDTSKSASNFWNTATGRWTGFILEITSGPNIGQRRPITNTSGTTLTVFPAFTAAVASGVTYKIREPGAIGGGGLVNRWKDRTLRLIEPDGTTTHDATITHSDDNTLYFATQGSLVTDAWSYQIIEYEPGTTWKIAGSRPDHQPIPMTDPDPRGQPWKTDSRLNLPTRVTRYGRFLNGDYAWMGVLNEIYRGINKLKWILRDFGWTANGEENRCAYGPGSSPGVVYGSGFSSPDDTYDGAWGHRMSDLQSIWGGFPPPVVFGPADDVAPYAQLDSEATTVIPSVGFQEGRGFIPEGQNLDRAFAYATISSVPTPFNSQVVFLAYATINPGDSDEGVVNNWSCPGAAYLSYHFDAQDTPYQFRKWANVGTSSVSNDATRISTEKVGNANSDFPSWTQPPDPVPHGHDCAPDPPGAFAQINSGYWTAASKAIIKFDVAGGLRFV